MTFTLAPRLAAGAFPVADTPHCVVLLKDDARWPWLILAPKLPDATELHDLAEDDYAALMGAVRAASIVMAALPGVEKVNVGMLGNIVRQLHVHVIGRHAGDAAWPGPVWGVEGKIAYAPGAGAALAERIATEMRKAAFPFL
jgi:diadenosine tetraphosphate (Ap4A) HIT family hydrolase